MYLHTNVLFNLLMCITNNATSRTNLHTIVWLIGLFIFQSIQTMHVIVICIIWMDDAYINDLDC